MRNPYIQNPLEAFASLMSTSYRQCGQATIGYSRRIIPTYIQDSILTYPRLSTLIIYKQDLTFW